MKWKQIAAACTLFFSAIFPLMGEEVWMLQQDFVKFGKKEVYESLQKEHFQELLKYGQTKALFPCYALQDLNSPEYFYLIPLKTYGGLELFFKQSQRVQNAFSKEEWDQKRLTKASTVNFKVVSLLKYLPTCSAISKAFESFLSLQRVNYWVFGVDPGQEPVFEAHLEEIAKKQQTNPSISWRVWRITVGGDLPRYLIMVFGAEQKAVDEGAQSLNFISGPIRQLLRKEKNASAVLRPDLSLVP
jgi:hypothetical protein